MPSGKWNRARPRKDRSKMLTVRMSASQYAMITTAAKLLGMPKGRLCRWILLVKADAVVDEFQGCKSRGVER